MLILKAGCGPSALLHPQIFMLFSLLSTSIHQITHEFARPNFYSNRLFCCCSSQTGSDPSAPCLLRPQLAVMLLTLPSLLSPSVPSSTQMSSGTGVCWGASMSNWTWEAHCITQPSRRSARKTVCWGACAMEERRSRLTPKVSGSLFIRVQFHSFYSGLTAHALLQK